MIGKMCMELNIRISQYIPIFWSSFEVFRLSKQGKVRRRATPPPGTIPSSTAAFVEFKASLYLSFFSFTSTSLDPPTYKHKKSQIIV